MTSPLPQYQPHSTPQGPRRSGLATASLVLGIIGLIIGWCTLGVPSIVALFLGIAAMRERPGPINRGNAVVGTVLGGVGTGIVLLAVAIGIADTLGNQ